MLETFLIIALWIILFYDTKKKKRKISPITWAFIFLLIAVIVLLICGTITSIKENKAEENLSAQAKSSISASVSDSTAINTDITTDTNITEPDIVEKTE